MPDRKSVIVSQDLQTTAPSDSPPAELAPQENPATPLVLVVDDEEDARAMYTAYLRHLGMRAATAADGCEALLKARTLSPDVIVMDFAMPHLQGDEATRLLKANPHTRHIPVIALTAHGPEARVRARAAGFDAFCEKPCLPAHLAGVIISVMTASGRAGRP